MRFAILLISCLTVINAIQLDTNMSGAESLFKGFFWARQDDSTRRFECQYVSETQTISCFRGLVECETVPHFEELSQNYEIFGVGTTDMTKFRLYPRKLSDLAFDDFKQKTTGGSWVELNFYASGEQPLTTARGLMVKDAQCFKRIVDLFKVIDNQVMVELVNKQKVTMLGYINYLSIEALKTLRELNNGTLPFGKAVNKPLDLSINRKFDRIETDSIVAGNPFLAPVSGFIGGSLEETNRRFECQYSSDLFTLSCFRGLVRCETITRFGELKNTYEIFGLGTTDMITYHLYPRNSSDLTFADYRVPLVSGSTVELSLLKSGMEGYGLVVRDAVCYQRIVDFLRVITEPVMVDVTGDNTNTKVQMMSYIINV